MMETRWKRILAIVLTVTLFVTMTGVLTCIITGDRVYAAESGNIPDVCEQAAYQEASWTNGVVTYSNKTADNCTPVTDSTEAVTWDESWYVVNGIVTIDQPITVNGDVNLILVDGCTLNAKQGIVVTENNSLTIYAQVGGTGTLNTTGVASSGNASAGIGGGTEIFDSGNITIHGGTITATGGGTDNIGIGGAGIGGGTNASGDGGSSGAITIYGGTVTANSGAGNNTGAGIGGGAGSSGNGGNGSDINISGGSVTATGGSRGAGIGGGAGGTGNGGVGSNITISGGSVNATGGSIGAGIGGGGGSSGSGSGTDITISGGEVTAIGGKYAAGIGGGGGYISIGSYSTTTVTGGTGTSISITGGIVDAKGGDGNSSGNYAGDSIGNGGNASGTADVTKTAGIIFENGEGKVHGTVALAGEYTVPAGYTLTFEEGGQFDGNYAFYQNGTPIEMAKVKSDGVTGPVTVQECKHTGVSSTPNNNGTHSLKCPYCGYTEAANCSYGTEYQHDDTNHWQTCEVCQGTTTPEAHYLLVMADEPVNGVTQNREACDQCDFTKNPFTVTVTVPTGLTYGNTVGIKPSYTISTEKTFNAVQLVLQDGEGNTEIMTGDTLPDNLSAGNYKLYLSGSVLGNPEPVFRGRVYFTVAPAPLTENMVTLSPESATYSGAEQKPTITVKQGDTTLAEGTDYDVTYSTTDFTNVGTITVTITGKGNYTGTVETTYTIKKAPLTITASDQTITYGESITQGTDDVTDVELCSGDRLDGITLTASTANVPGGNITPSAAGIKNSGGKDVTGNYEITYKDGRLTINKADTEITLGTDTYNKTFGDPAFILDVTDNNTEADVQYEVTGGTDVVSVSNETVTIQNAGTATITVSLPETANYNAAESKTITVSVAKKDGYTVAEMNRSYLYSRENTGSIDLAALLPKDCGTAAYGTPEASGNVTYNAAPAVSDGKLSYTLNSGNINDEGTITVTVATQNYTDITITVKMKLTDQIPVSLKTGTEVTLKDNVLTYGETLSKLIFNEAEFVGDDGNTVAGTLAWKDAAATPNAGTASAVWVFTPADTAYVEVEGTAAITVNKAAPTVSETPAVADRVYNPSRVLEQGDLSGITVTGMDGNTLKGEWSWKSANIIPTVNNSGYVAVFTPTDATNYENVTSTVTVNVTKATPYIAELPTAAGITYGDTLNVSALSGGTVQYGNGTGQAGSGAGSTETVAGIFTWKESSTRPAVADSGKTEYTVVFTPSDTINYEAIECSVTLTVQKAVNAPNMPDSTMDVPNSCERVSDVALPENWEWKASDQDTVFEAGKAVNAVAVYTGADKGSYEKETVTITITRASCDHVAGEILYTGEGEKAPACELDGLGHRECTKCGSVTETGIVIPALKHNYTDKVTKEPTTESEGIRTYICSRCGNQYTESIAKLPEETHQHSYKESVTKESTCTDTGIRTFSCSCGDEYTESIPALGHKHTEIKGKVEPACVTEGYTGDTYCTDCNEKIESGITIKALGHDYSGKITKEATKEEEGIYTYTCSHCGDTYTQSIPKLPGTSSGNTSNQENKIPVKGEVISDAKSKAVYTVTQAGKTGGTVSYTKSADNKATSISVPNTVVLNGISYKVTAIAQNAFKNNKKLTKVTIGNNITAIGNNAFYGCKKLKNVSMGTNVTTIGTKAFYKCTSVTKITIPAKVSKIGKQAFYGCKKLKTITIKTKKLTSKKVGSKAFKGIHSKATVKVPKSKLKIYKQMLKAKGIGSKVKVKK